MKTIVLILAVANLSGCTGIATLPDADAPAPVKAAAIAADAALTMRIWELWGWIK